MIKTLRQNFFLAAFGVSILIHILGLGIFLSFANETANIPVNKVRFVKVKVGQMNYKSGVVPQKVKHKKAAKTKRKAGAIPKSKPVHRKPQTPKIMPAKEEIRIPRISLIATQKSQPSIFLKPKVPKSFSQNTIDSPNEVKENRVQGTEIGNRTHAETELIDSYKKRLVLWLGQHKSYPKGASRQDIKAIAVIQLQISSDGELLFYDVSRKTGYAALDQSILEMIVASNPFPPFPEDYHDVAVDQFEVTVAFNP